MEVNHSNELKEFIEKLNQEQREDHICINKYQENIYFLSKRISTRSLILNKLDELLND